MSKREPGAPLRRGTSASRLGLCVGLLVAGLVFLLYFRTLAPDVLYYERPDLIDAAVFQAMVYALGITHPTGYPIYLLLTHLFTYLPFGDIAYRVNLASAVYGAAAVFLVFLVGLRLSRRVWAAAVGALAFGVGNTFWSRAILPGAIPIPHGSPATPPTLHRAPRARIVRSTYSAASLAQEARR